MINIITTRFYYFLVCASALFVDVGGITIVESAVEAAIKQTLSILAGSANLTTSVLLIQNAVIFVLVMDLDIIAFIMAVSAVLPRQYNNGVGFVQLGRQQPILTVVRP